MATLNLQESVKRDLRITNTKQELEIYSAIETAKQRLSQIGVKFIADDDPTTVTAIKLYCRAWFNFQGDGERYKASFESLANAMSQAREYRGD